MNIPINFPPEVINESLEHFHQSAIEHGKKLIDRCRVSISFTKKTPGTYYIVSGIVKDNRTHECKIVYKRRLIDTPEGPLSSNCDCNLWTKENHCPHTAALFLSFNAQQQYDDNDDESYIQGNGSYPPIPAFGGMGVGVLEYGTIIKGPHLLEGAHHSSTYSAMQYILDNRKVINFPIPKKFEGKLLIDVTSRQIFNNDHEALENLPVIKFKYENSQGVTIKEISLFENLYLFNWITGEALQIPREIKSIIHTFIIHSTNLNVNELIQMVNNLSFSGSPCEIIIDNTPLPDLKVTPVNTRITLAPGAKNKYIEFSMVFHDNEDNVIIPPEFLTAFTFTGGLLGTFRKKQDAYEFIQALTESIKENNKVYTKSLLSCSQKEKWINLVDFKNPNTYVYDENGHHLCEYNNELLKTLLVALHDSFGEMLFRYSEYNSVSREITFQISANNLFQNLFQFNLLVSPYNVSVFYNRNQIAFWSSRISFERRTSSTKWFDLELNIPNMDMQVIKNADLDNGLALTSSGLVLLGKEQKELLKFMQKYTKYESVQNSGPNQDNDNNKIKGNRYILPFNRTRIFELFELKRLGIEGALSKEEEDLCTRLTTMENMPTYPLPPSLEGIIRPYQQIGYNWLRFLYENRLGACLADDMGLGKTLQSIAFIKSIHDKIERILIVCPVSILLNWEMEIEKFSDMEAYIYHGGERNFPDNVKIILTSYGVMKREAQGPLQDRNFDVLILDEVQQLKNIRSLGAYSARKINANFRVCLTGTPVENDLAEFYNIIDLSIPGIWGDPQFIRTTSTKKSRLLARKTAAPFILRRTKAQVLSELPPKIENTVYLEMSEPETLNYHKTLVQVRHRINTSPSRRKYGEILKGLLELRQKCLWQKNPHLESTKIDFLIEQLIQIVEEGHQAIVFSQFTTYLDLIQNALADKPWSLARIDGSQTIKKRQKQVDQFQNGDSPVFLISLKAGGQGLNLTAASYVFLMDPWWNPAVESQAIDRAHRIGQKSTLTVYRPIIKNSIEEKVLALQDIKKELFYDLLPDNEESYFSGKLTMKDFEHLFS